MKHRIRLDSVLLWLVWDWNFCSLINVFDSMTRGTPALIVVFDSMTRDDLLLLSIGNR